MLFLLSPAKTLDFESAALVGEFSQPRLIDQSAALIEDAKALNVDDVKSLMGVSDKIAELNVNRFHSWSVPFDVQNAKQAVYAFKGDVYTGLNIETCSESQVAYVNSNVRILSGLYGLLRPLDLMQPYRLEMGVKFQSKTAENLYKFWGKQLSELINSDLCDEHDPVVVNLASNEYFKAIDTKQLEAPIITAQFKQQRGNDYKMIGIYAKRARGLMTRYLAKNQASSVDDIKRFNLEGYCLNKSLSNDTTLVFTRKED